MRIIPDMWRFAEICSHEPTGEQPLFSGSIFTPMKNDLDFGYIADFKDRLIICFMGTKNLQAWISDFDVFPLRDDSKITNGHWGEGSICDGFYTGWSEFKKPITDYLIRNQNDSKKNIICTGHSRGGVLAILCARHLAKNLNMPCSCISFGSPAPGNKKCRDVINKLPIDLTRVVHGYDIVTYLPPEELGFKQPGKKEWLKESILHKLIPHLRIKDHFYSTYTKGLIKYCKQKQDAQGIEEMKKILKTAHP